MHVDIESTDPSVVTVFPDEPLATVETVDLTGVGVGVALVRADVNDQDVFSCAPLEVHVFDPAIKSVAIVRVIEDNDDVQAIGVAQGLANQVSIQAAPAQPLATTPNGDDAVVPAGDAIHNGPDGVCQTTAVGTDVQVIPVAQGVPFVPVVLGGANGHLESSPGGDDTILGNDILAGLNGICETTANQTDVPAADLSVPLLANYLDFQVFDQAVVTWLATELPDLEVNWDLDNDGKFEIGGAEEQALVSAGIGAGFDQVVFLVPQIRDDLLLGDLIGVTTLGYTYLGTKFCFVDVANSDQLSDARQIVAHELGHANGSLQHKPNDPLNLMHPISGPAKTRLLRDQWHDLNP
jgi:hypothetical protein